MLKTQQEFLTTEQLASLKDWLRAPGARLFQKVVQARVYENQIEATRDFTSERVRGKEEGNSLLFEAEHYRNALKVIEEFSDIKTKPYTVKIVED